MFGMQGSPISPTIQNMIGEAIANTKKALSGKGSITSWMIIGLVIFGVIFIVKKVSK